MKNSFPSVESGVDVTTGKPFAPAAAPAPMRLPKPVAGPGVEGSNPGGTNDSGENAGSWVGTLDIYWKLNWIREELQKGNVPRVLPDVVARQRKHLTRILHENKHLAPDPGHYIPDGVTIPEVLTYADAALKQLEVGLEHLQKKNLLEAAGIRTLAVTWNMSEQEITQQFARQGLIKTERAAATVEQDDDGSAPLVVRRPHSPRTGFVTPQDEAVALALQYARDYHASPEEMARRAFEKALGAIIQMRNLLHYEYHKPSVPGSNTMIPGLLHQEMGALPPTSSPLSSKGVNDPFRQSGDSSQSVIDPFREGGNAPPLR